MIAGGIISAAGFTRFAKAEPPAEKRRPQNVKSYSGTTRCIPIRGSINRKSPFMDMDLRRNMPMKRVLRLVCALTRLRRRIWGENGYRHARPLTLPRVSRRMSVTTSISMPLCRLAPPGLSTRCIRLPWAIKCKGHTASRPDHSRLGGSAE